MIGQPSAQRLRCRHGLVAIFVEPHALLRQVARAEEAVAAADDAVRSRSLHAIAGATVGIGIWTASLAVAGFLLALLARLGVAAVETGANGTAVPVAAAGLLVLLVLCVIVPVVSFVQGRRLMQEPFAVARRTEASA